MDKEALVPGPPTTVPPLRPISIPRTSSLTPVPDTPPSSCFHGNQPRESCGNPPLSSSSAFALEAWEGMGGRGSQDVRGHTHRLPLPCPPLQGIYARTKGPSATRLQPETQKKARHQVGGGGASLRAGAPTCHFPPGWASWPGRQSTWQAAALDGVTVPGSSRKTWVPWARWSMPAHTHQHTSHLFPTSCSPCFLSFT